MFDIALSFFENLSPELISAPLTFLKAELWEGGGAPRKPTHDEIVEEIKRLRRQKPDELVDITFLDFKYVIDVPDMISNAPVDYVLSIKDDIVSHAWEIYKTEDWLHKKVEKSDEKMHQAQKRLINLAYDHDNIASQAHGLSHQSQSDKESVLEWGLEIENAVGRFLNRSLETSRKNGYHQKNQASVPTQQLKDVLETSQVGALRRAFINMRLSVPPMWPFTQGGHTLAKNKPQLALKVADFDTRMTKALETLSELEEACKGDVKTGKERIQSYEDTQKTISTFYDILESYYDALSEQAPRLKREEAEWFQSGGDPNDKLRAKFKDTSLKIKEDIANRLHALRQTLHVCEIEYGAYETMIEAEKTSWDSINHLIKTQIPLFRQQLIQAQNIKTGRETVQIDGLSADTQKLTGQKLRDAAAQEIIDGVFTEIKNTAEMLNNIADNEIKAITKAEILMIEDQRPVAMIEDQREAVPQVG